MAPSKTPGGQAASAKFQKQEAQSEYFTSIGLSRRTFHNSH